MEKTGKKSSDTEIDYQYPDEQLDTQSDSDFDFQQQSSGSPPQKKTGLLSRFTKKQLVISALVIMVLFAVYQVLTQKDKEAAEVAQPKIEPEKTKSAPVKTQTTEKKIVQQTPVKQPTINLAPSQTGQVSQNQLNQVENQFQTVNKEVVELKEAMSTLVSAIEVLAGQVQELRTAQQLNPSTFMPFKPKIVYHLKAVVPGRAWLESKDDNLITVKEGDAIPGYGTVNKIDANEGWIETSSGLVIRYGKNDS